jgi:hypothetical protein
MVAMLRLNVPWLRGEAERVGDLAISGGPEDVLTYDDGISLQVVVLDPAACTSADELVARARVAGGPGRVVLAAGAVPVEWRAELRGAEVSFMDAGGVAEIAWPRLRAASGRFAGQPVVRHREPMPLQKGHALVVQELAIAAGNGEQPLITELAQRAQVSMSTASRAVAQLAEYGLAGRDKVWRQVRVGVPDLAGLANLLADRTAWPRTEMVCGYAWGRTIWDVAATISRNAAEVGVTAAVTGRVAAGFLGVFGTSSPREVRCWVNMNGQSLADNARLLGLEPSPPESANVRLSADPWRIGVHRREDGRLDNWTAVVAHPLRVWCDLHGEERGRDFASQLWGEVSHAQ